MAIAFAAAIAGATCLAVAYVRDPDLTLDMDRGIEGVESGFYSPERDGALTFAWTSRSAAITLRGIDARSEWNCSLRARGGRPASVPQPELDVGVDGIRVARYRTTNEYRDFDFQAVSYRGEPGLSISLTSSPTFVPGPSDRRELGVQVDRVLCRPAEGTRPHPPLNGLSAASWSAAIFGAGFVIMGLGVPVSLVGVLLVTALQTIPLTAGAALYAPYPGQLLTLALWIVALVTAAVLIADRRERLGYSARVAVAVTASVLFVKLIALLHPAKPIIDALFHAHRLEAVLGGNYYFTQPLPSGVRFPYAIALYVVTAPWTRFTSDHIALLRLVVASFEAIAGLLLYWMVVRTRGDGRMGLLAVVLFHLVPSPYTVAGNANLTYAFGESAALMTMAAAAVWRFRIQDVWQWLGLLSLSSLAFLSHVGVFPIALTALTAQAVLYIGFGAPELRASGRSILLVTACALVLSIASYYGHFIESYRSFRQVSAQSVRATDQARAAPVDTRSTSNLASRGTALPQRLRNEVTYGLRALGWPIVALACIGICRLCLDGIRDRFGLALMASLMACAGFLAIALGTAVEPRFERYTVEFIDRVHYAAAPAIVLLAARGAAWAWCAGVLLRVFSAALIASATIVPLQRWIAWVT